MLVKNDEHDLIDIISQKSLDLIPIINTNTNTNTHLIEENLQVVEYDIDNYYNEHYDAVYGPKSYCKEKSSRLATILIYLNDDYIGGEKPEKVKAILFYNIDENNNVIKESLHKGNPIISGKKYICNKWIRINN